MASREQSLSPSIMDKLLQDCLVKLEQIDMFTCEICDTMYCDEESLTRHLATHMTRDDTVTYKECASRIEPRHKTSHIKLSENNVIKTETRHKQSIRDRIIFDSDSIEGTLKTEVSDDNMSFVSEGDTLSTSDYPLFSASNNDNLGTFNVEENVPNSSRELAEDIRNKVNESTSNSVSTKNIQSYGRLIPCNMCDMYFAHISSLKLHQLTHQKKVVVTGATEDSPDKPTQKVEMYVCDLCEKEFLKKKYLRAHLKSHYLKKFWKCKFCNKKFKHKIEMQRHERVHTDEKPYSCNKCNIFFRNYSSYSFHRRAVHTDGIKICGYCDRQYSEKSSLSRHIMSVHMRGYPKARASHMVIHEKRFICSCGKSFQTKSGVIRHEDMHKKPFECDYCNMRFGKKCHVERHIKNSCKKVPKLQRKYYECNICHREYNKYNLSVHSKTCKWKPHCCLKCRRMFAKISNLRRHRKKYKH